MIVGGFLGIFFVTLLRRVMVEDPELPFPESTAASEIHKAGQRGLGAAMDLVWAMIVGAGVYLAGAAKLFSASRDFFIHVGTLGKSALRLWRSRRDRARPCPPGASPRSRRPTSARPIWGSGTSSAPNWAR